MEKKITAPLDDKTAKELKIGDYVYITGTIYTARDAAHKRMYEALEKGGKLPFDINNNIIYYMGPSPAREGCSIGSAGRNSGPYFSGIQVRKSLRASSLILTESVRM